MTRRDLDYGDLAYWFTVSAVAAIAIGACGLGVFIGWLVWAP